MWWNCEMYWGKFKKSPNKASRVRFYKVCILTPNFDWFSQICEAKNFFFWEMIPTFDNFPNWPTYQRVFWDQNQSKKVNLRKDGIFPVDLVVKNSLTKMKKIAILRLSWRGSNNSKRYILQFICVNKDCFYPIQVLKMKFWIFGSFPRVPKFVEIS